MNRHHPKRFKSPTFDFAHKKRPPEEGAAERAEKDRLIQAAVAAGRVTKCPPRKPE